MPTRKVMAMDEDFADVMYELGDVHPAGVKRRWAVIDAHVGNIAKADVPRLVQLAHEVPGDREADRWFWGPFKVDDDTFPVAGAARLHATLAGFYLRIRIRTGRHPIDAHLVKLAGLQGLVSPLGDLQTLAGQVLLRAAVVPPAPQGGITVSDGGDPAQSADVRLGALAKSASQAVTDLVGRIDRLNVWAQDAERRFNREQEVVQWLLAGRRSDGVQWEDLDAGAVVLDAASELALIVAGAPQPQHENVLGQILRLANVSNTGEVNLSVAITPVPVVDNEALATSLSLTCLRGAVDGDGYSLALRALWERATLALWTSSL